LSQDGGQFPEVSRDRGAFARTLGTKSQPKPDTLVITGSDGSKAAMEVTTGSGEPADNSKATTSVITGFLPSGGGSGAGGRLFLPNVSKRSKLSIGRVHRAEIRHIGIVVAL
jgi:hypothetical protein